MQRKMEALSAVHSLSTFAALQPQEDEADGATTETGPKTETKQATPPLSVPSGAKPRGEPGTRGGRGGREVPIKAKQKAVIIGRGGATIRQLQADSGASISVESDVVHLRGSKQAIDKANMLLQELLASGGRRTKLAVSKEEEEAELKRLGYRSWAEANAAFDGANGSGWQTIPNRRAAAPTASAQLAALLSARVPTSRELGADRARHLAMQALGPHDA